VRASDAVEVSWWFAHPVRFGVANPRPMRAAAINVRGAD
jgi:hypothetical protein